MREACFLGFEHTHACCVHLVEPPNAPEAGMRVGELRDVAREVSRTTAGQVEDRKQWPPQELKAA